MTAWVMAAALAAATLRLHDDPSRREMVLDLGPLHLPAGAGHHGVEQPVTQWVRAPLDAWVHGFELEIVDDRGRAVPQRVLHHVNVILADRRELCSDIMQRLVAMGEETSGVDLPRLLGVPLRAGERMVVMAMLDNPTGQEWRDVHLRLRLRYTPRGAWPSPLAVQPFYMDVMPPAGKHAYDLPPGRSAQSWQGRPAVSGRVLGLGGHLHEHGVALKLEDVTTGEVLWEAKPELDDEGEVVGVPRARFFWKLGVPLRSDHEYRLTALYDNPTGRTIEDGAMGTLGGVFLPARGARWPGIDPTSDQYLGDVEFLAARPGGTLHRGH